MAEARVDLDVVGSAHRIDRAVAAGDGAELRLGGTLLHLVGPVDAFLVSALGVEDAQLPADVRDLRIGEGAHERPQRVRRPGAVGVGERDDLAVRLAHRAVLCSDLATAWIRDHLHAGKLQCDLLGAVRRRVGADDDLQLVRRVVELEQVLEPPRDHRLFVVGRDDDGDRRLDVRLLHPVRREPRQERSERRVDHVRPGEQREGNPEKDKHDSHSRSIVRWPARAARRTVGARPERKAGRGSRSGEDGWSSVSRMLPGVTPSGTWERPRDEAPACD